MSYPHNPRHPGAGAGGPARRGPYRPPNAAPWQRNPPAQQRPVQRPPAQQGPPARRPPQAPPQRGGSGPKRALGQIDPFCYVAAGPLFLAGITLAFIAGNAWIGVVGVAFAVALLLFDARVNRPR